MGGSGVWEAYEPRFMPMNSYVHSVFLNAVPHTGSRNPFLHWGKQTQNIRSLAQCYMHPGTLQGPAPQPTQSTRTLCCSWECQSSFWASASPSGNGGVGVLLSQADYEERIPQDTSTPSGINRKHPTLKNTMWSLSRLLQQIDRVP